MRYKLFPFQETGVAFLTERRRALNADDMGCLSKDTIIKVARGNGKTGTRTVTLDKLYRTWVKNPNVPTYIKAYTGKELKLHRVTNVIYSGKKPVYLLKTRRGYKIKATSDHEFLRHDGVYTPLSRLKVGSRVLVNGKKVTTCAECTATYDTSEDIRRVHPHLCCVCARIQGAQKKKTLSKELPPLHKFDRDGYIRVKQEDHPYKDNLGYVLLHRLVMEKSLGRYLKYPDEIVHHRDGNIRNNEICNLEVVSTQEHHARHPEKIRHLCVDKYGNKIWWVPEEDTVISKKYIGIEDTYDVSMEDPYRNFVASGFVVHNCGKSIQAMESVRRLSVDMEKTNVLLVCPASLTLMWDRFLRMWFHDEDMEIVHMKGVKSAVTLSKKRRFVIVSYNYIQKPENVERLKKLRWHFIISDESHAMKNFKSKTCKGFKKLITGHSGYVWLFTGTPATRSGQDYYPYLEFIQPGKWGTLHDFSEMFCNVRIDYWSGGKKYEGVKESKRPLLRKAFNRIMIRRRKEEVIQELPSRLDTVLPVTVPDDLVNESKHIPAEIIRNAVETGVLTSEHVARMMRAIGLAKVDAAVEYILGTHEPIVVFCCHHDVIDSIADA